MANYYTEICLILMIIVMVHESKTNASSIPEETSIRVYSRGSSQISIYFYRFNTTSGVKFSYDIQYRERGQRDWTRERTISHFASSTDQSSVFRVKINGLKADVTYQIKASYYSVDRIKHFGESTIIEARTYPLRSVKEGNRAYRFSHDDTDLDEDKERKTFEEASLYCNSLGAELASVVSEKETYFALNAMLVDSGPYWIGLEMKPEEVLHCNTCNLCYIGVSSETNCQLCESCRNKWTWRDGFPMIWQNWEEQQPNENKRCGVLNINGKWYDSDCNDKNYFICSEEMKCSELKAPNHGRVTVSRNSYGTSATYYCQAGYRLIGSSTRECLVFSSEANVWLGTEPICEYDGENDPKPSTATEASVIDHNVSDAEQASNKGWTITLAVVAVIVVLMSVINIVVVVFVYKSLLKAQTQGNTTLQRSPGNQYENESFHNITGERSKPTAPPSNDQLMKIESKRPSTSGGNVNNMVRYYANKECDEQEHYESIKPS